ncbi:hypothetical protein [Aquimarina aggregata]|uniref:hypothetical protein n=1 Tax=Aquimarina aggregata TaxID=1642818 RepID=UPI002491AC04|nr:hypothetical protein [Aquimarina aggregata]
MTNNVPLDLLGKHINGVPEAYTLSTTKSDNGIIYMVDVLDYYFGKPYTMVFITADNNDIIQNFAIYVDEIIDKPFYEEMVAEYGEPNCMFKKGKITSVDTTIAKNDLFESKGRTTYELEECTFDESPVVFGWHKENYDIQVIIGDESDTFQKTRIIFGKGILANIDK